MEKGVSFRKEMKTGIKEWENAGWWSLPSLKMDWGDASKAQREAGALFSVMMYFYSYFSCFPTTHLLFSLLGIYLGATDPPIPGSVLLARVPLEGIFSRIINRHPDAAHCSAGSGPRFPHPTPSAMLFRPLHPAGLIRHRHPPDCAPSLLKAQLVHYRVQKADPWFCNSPLLFTSLPQYCINIHI